MKQRILSLRVVAAAIASAARENRHFRMAEPLIVLPQSTAVKLESPA